MKEPVTLQIPETVQLVLQELKDHHFDAYIVGGCVRDLLMGREPKDWDITTNALPDEMQKIFITSTYNNEFGTVLVHVKDEIIEVTTYRAETQYTDKRHPDAVKFGVSLTDDLARRDFTVNALAYDGTTIVDEFDGRRDIQRHLIRAVGDPSERFAEDALRMMRAVRFSAELNFKIHPATWNAIIHNLDGLSVISKERIRDELMKIVASDDPWKGFWYLYQTGLLDRIIPELVEGVGMSQPRHHIYTVFVHSLLSLAFCPSADPIVRLAALLHDVGKPVSAQGDDEHRTFYNHEVISAEMTRRIMRRLKFSKKDIDRAVLLVRQHMFYYNMGEITDAGVRRLLRRVGPENMKDLMDLRIGDRMGGGTQKEKPYKFVELEKRIEEVQKDPIDTRMLEIDGNRVMEMLELKPGPKVGYVMQTLLNEILDDPSRNTVEYLESRVDQLAPDVAGLTDRQAKDKEIELRERTQTYEN